MTRRLTSAQLDELLAAVRRESALTQYKRAGEEWQMREAWKAAEKARNYQHEYGTLVEANARLPIALQGAAMKRMESLGQALTLLRRKYPRNFPRGPSREAAGARDFGRLIA